MTPNTPADGNALAEAIAELPMVKPLEWEGDKKDHAAGLGYIYMLVHYFDGWRWFRCIGRELNGVSDGVFPAIEAAEAAAQADYTARIHAALIPRPAEPAQAAQVDANQRRADAATLLLDMLYMRNGAHEGLDRDAVEKMWNAVREDDGFPSVVQFLSVIAAAQEGRE